MSQSMRGLAVASRKSTRMCALQFRGCRERGWHELAERWLTFALYHRVTSEQWVSGETVLPPELERKVNWIILDMAARL